MKKGFLLLLLCSSVFVNAQSLKEALFGGKLKNDAGTVIRKGDDLSTKIDTTTRKPPVDSAVVKATTTNTPANDAVAATTATQPSPVIAAGQEKKDASVAATDSSAAGETAEAQNAAAVPETAVVKPTNNSVLKGFMDTLVSTLKTDVIPSKRLKEGNYLVLISYAIETDGQLSFNDVFVSPENNFLQDQIKQRLAIDVPRLQPEVTSTGKPRKVNKKYKFTLEKQ